MQEEIPFHKAFVSGKESAYCRDMIDKAVFDTGSYFSKEAIDKLRKLTACPHLYLTGSATQALEMAALALDIGPGDEVIMASFNFVSCANAFALRGAKIVFVDIRPDTMNIDEGKIESAITPRTKVIVAMHYGSVACDMATIMTIADKHGLYVVEDAAHCIDAYLGDRHLGTIGHFGVLSFNSIMNIQCGEGGALLVNDRHFVEDIEILREKGTNRRLMLQGRVDKYTWQRLGSSFLLSELNAAFLLGQMLVLEEVTQFRRDLVENYRGALAGVVEVQPVPANRANGHIFYIKTADAAERRSLILFLRKQKIHAAFHYIPLHKAPAGLLHGVFSGRDEYTTRESERLLRLPVYYGLEAWPRVVEAVRAFYNGRS